MNDRRQPRQQTSVVSHAGRYSAHAMYPTCTCIPRDSNVVPFWLWPNFLLIRNDDILPKKIYIGASGYARIYANCLCRCADPDIQEPVRGSTLLTAPFCWRSLIMSVFTLPWSPSTKTGRIRDVSVYANIRTYIRTYTCTYTYTYTYAIHIRIHMHIHIHLQVQIHIHMHMQRHIRIHVQIHIHTHVQIHIPLHCTYIHKCIYVYDCI